MSFVKSALGFELFNGKHILKDLGKHPWRALTGIDPASTTVWNKVLGRNDQPLVDQMGGAYGGHFISAFGNKDGGVYQDARDHGIDTKPAGYLQDAAHIVAAIYGLNGLPGGDSGGGMQMPSMPQQQPEQQTTTDLRQVEAERRRKAMIAQALRESGNQSAFPDSTYYG